MQKILEKLHFCERIKRCYIAYLIAFGIQLLFTIITASISAEGMSDETQKAVTTTFLVIQLVIYVAEIIILGWFCFEYFKARKLTKGIKIAFIFSIIAVALFIASVLTRTLGSTYYITGILEILSIVCAFFCFEFFTNTLVQVDRPLRYRINVVMAFVVIILVFYSLLTFGTFDATASLVFSFILFTTFVINEALCFMVVCYIENKLKNQQQELDLKEDK